MMMIQSYKHNTTRRNLGI